jgi:hypothetical protein
MLLINDKIIRNFARLSSFVVQADTDIGVSVIETAENRTGSIYFKFHICQNPDSLEPRNGQ